MIALEQKIEELTQECSVRKEANALLRGDNERLRGLLQKAHDILICTGCNYDSADGYHWCERCYGIIGEEVRAILAAALAEGKDQPNATT
jgi:hypothetical protein